MTWLIHLALTAIRPGPTCLFLDVERYFSPRERFSRSSNVPRRYSSFLSHFFSGLRPLPQRVNAAFGNFSQTARSSAVIVSHPKVNMYRPGSANRPICAQVVS